MTTALKEGDGKLPTQNDFQLPLSSERPMEVDPDGWVYDPDTGEVLGHEQIPVVFEVRSSEDADWVLELRSEIEARLIALDIRQKALVDQIQTLKREQMRRLSWWEYRFGPSLVAFARTLLAGSKKRTAQFTWGKVAFRRSPGRTSILDMDAAVEFVSAWAPEQVRVERSVTLSGVEAAVKAAARATGEMPARLLWVAHSGPEERCTISTGVSVGVADMGEAP